MGGVGYHCSPYVILEDKLEVCLSMNMKFGISIKLRYSLWIILVLTNFLVAQTTGKISGTVTDSETGEHYREPMLYSKGN